MIVCIDPMTRACRIAKSRHRFPLCFAMIVGTRIVSFANSDEVWSAPKFSVSLFRYVIELCRAANVRYFNSSVVSTRRRTVSKVTRWLSFGERFLREFLQLATEWGMVTRARIFINKYDKGRIFLMGTSNEVLERQLLSVFEYYENSIRLSRKFLSFYKETIDARRLSFYIVLPNYVRCILFCFYWIGN